MSICMYKRENKNFLSTFQTGNFIDSNIIAILMVCLRFGNEYEVNRDFIKMLFFQLCMNKYLSDTC